MCFLNINQWKRAVAQTQKYKYRAEHKQVPTFTADYSDRVNTLRGAAGQAGGSDLPSCHRAPDTHSAEPRAQWTRLKLISSLRRKTKRQANKSERNFMSEKHGVFSLSGK